MYSFVRSTRDKYEFTNKLQCQACGNIFYLNRYYNEPKYCSQSCFWYKDEIKQERGIIGIYFYELEELI